MMNTIRFHLCTSTAWNSSNWNRVSSSRDSSISATEPHAFSNLHASHKIASCLLTVMPVVPERLCLNICGTVETAAPISTCSITVYTCPCAHVPHDLNNLGKSFCEASIKQDAITWTFSVLHESHESCNEIKHLFLLRTFQFIFK